MSDSEHTEHEAEMSTIGAFFTLFTEIGIIAQLSRAMFESRLPDGITVPQFSVLNHLLRVRDGQTPLVIAQAFQVPKTSMTNTLAQLERRGLIKMRKNPEDARSKQVWITESGTRFRDEAIQMLATDITRLSDQIRLEDVAATLPALEHLRRVLDADRD